MTLQISGGSLLYENGGLANDSDCCCDPDCPSSRLPGTCECHTSGVVDQIDSIDVTLSGTAKATGNTGFLFGAPVFWDDEETFDWGGTYSCDCTAYEAWRAFKKIASDTIYDYYYGEILYLHFQFRDAAQISYAWFDVQIDFGCGFYAWLNKGDTNPCPTPTNGSCAFIDGFPNVTYGESWIYEKTSNLDFHPTDLACGVWNCPYTRACQILHFQFVYHQ